MVVKEWDYFFPQCIVLQHKDNDNGYHCAKQFFRSLPAACPHVSLKLTTCQFFKVYTKWQTWNVTCSQPKPRPPEQEAGAWAALASARGKRVKAELVLSKSSRLHILILVCKSCNETFRKSPQYECSAPQHQKFLIPVNIWGKQLSISLWTDILRILLG